MNSKNVIINGLKILLPERYSVRDIMEKFFDLRCEFLVSVNSKPVPNINYDSRLIRENDNLQIATYSKYAYKLNKRTIFRPESEE